VFLPLSAELWIKGHKEKLKQAMELLYKYTFVVVIPVAFVLLMFPKLIIKLLFGAAYTDASIAMQILAVGTIFYTIGNINGTVLAGIGKPGENTKIILFAALFNLVTNLIFIPEYGIMGAAGTTCASWFLIFAVTSYKAYKHIGAVAPVFGWIKNFIAGAAFISVIYFLKAWLEMNVFLEMAISIGAAAIVYLALVLLFRIVTRKDLSFAKYALGVKHPILDYFLP
jgi:O-antigen/teichoic acid export membrane protein